MVHIFHVLWTLLLYVLLVAVIVVGLVYAAFTPVAKAIAELNAGAAFTDAVNLILTQGNFAEGANKIVDTFNSIIAVLTSPGKIGWLFLWLSLIVGVLGRFLIALYELPLTSLIEGHMSSNANFKFLPRFVGMIGKSCKASLVKMIFAIPYDAAAGLILYGVSRLWHVQGLFFLMPFCLAAALIILLALKEVFFCLWRPEIVLTGKPIFKCLFSGAAKSLKNIKRVFSVMTISWLCVLALNFFFALVLFGAGLIITVPVSMLFMSIVRMTLYYNIDGRRYYLNETNIYTPPSRQEPAKEE